jgi:hypothetical protein
MEDAKKEASSVAEELRRLGLGEWKQVYSRNTPGTWELRNGPLTLTRGFAKTCFCTLSPCILTRVDRGVHKSPLGAIRDQVKYARERVNELLAIVERAEEIAGLNAGSTGDGASVLGTF